MVVCIVSAPGLFACLPNNLPHRFGSTIFGAIYLGQYRKSQINKRRRSTQINALNIKPSEDLAIVCNELTTKKTCIMKQLRHMQECMGTVRRFASDNGLGRLFYDRDYHVHLGGAISPLLVAQWIESGQLSIHDNIPDLVSASSSDHGFIKVWDALVKYRGIDEALFLTAYNTPNYSNLPTFLTMYRAYSKRHLLYEHAAAIARGEFMHSHADVRVSLPVPNEHSVDDESEMQYAYRAVEDMLHYYSSLLPTQRLFMTVPRQTFNMCKNYGYFNSFVNTLAEMSENAALFSNQEPASNDRATL